MATDAAEYSRVVEKLTALQLWITTQLYEISPEAALSRGPDATADGEIPPRTKIVWHMPR